MGGKLRLDVGLDAHRSAPPTELLHDGPRELRQRVTCPCGGLDHGVERRRELEEQPRVVRLARLGLSIPPRICGLRPGSRRSRSSSRRGRSARTERSGTGAALAGTTCESLLPIRAIEELGVRARPISRAERTSDRCVVELAPVPGSYDVASLQLVVETGTRGSIARTARRAGSRATALPELGPDAWQIEHDAGTRILIARDGAVIRIQLARSAYSSVAVDRVIAHLVAAR